MTTINSPAVRLDTLYSSVNTTTSVINNIPFIQGDSSFIYFGSTSISGGSSASQLLAEKNKMIRCGTNNGVITILENSIPTYTRLIFKNINISFSTTIKVQDTLVGGGGTVYVNATLLPLSYLTVIKLSTGRWISHTGIGSPFI